MKERSRIALIDDEPGVLRALSLLLEALGVMCVSFEYPVQALDEISKTPHAFDAVITDLRMPQLTGIELLIKITPVFPLAQCGVISGHIGKQEEITLIELGVGAIARKPIMIQDLQALIKKLIP